MHDLPRAAPDLTCRELVELVTEYLEDALSPADRARFERHLAECDGCAAYVGQMRGTIWALGHLGDRTARPTTLDALREVFRDWRAQT